MRPTHNCSTAWFILILGCLVASAALAKPISQGPRGVIHRGIGPDGVGDLPFPEATIWMRRAGAQAFIIECANPTQADLSNYSITLRVPAGYEIMDPSGRFENWGFQINMPEVTRTMEDGRQVVKLAFRGTIPPGDMDGENGYHRYGTLLVLRALPTANGAGWSPPAAHERGVARPAPPTADDTRLEYTYLADDWTGPSGSMTVRLLPDLPGTIDKPSMLLCPVDWYLVHFNEAEARALLQTVHDAGFDTVHINNYHDELLQQAEEGSWLRGFIPTNREHARLADELGFRIIFSLIFDWGKDLVVFDKQPEHQAIGPDGNPVDRIPCPEWWVDEGYKRHWETMQREMDLHHADMYMRGNECNTWHRYCFCDRCKRAFGEAKQLPDAEKLTGEKILEQYRDDWLDFRCMQYARVCQRFREGAYQARPGSQFSIYSGLQDPWCKEKYTTDWRYLGNSCDWAVGTIGDFGVTRQALDGTPLMGRVGIYHSPTQLYGTQLMDWYLDSGAYGLRVFALSYYDGRILQAAAFLSNFMARFGDILAKHTRHDDWAQTDSESVKARVLVSEGDRNRLVVVSNNSGESVQATATIAGIEQGWSARVYPSGENLADPARASLTLAPWSVQAVELAR